MKIDLFFYNTMRFLNYLTTEEINWMKSNPFCTIRKLINGTHYKFYYIPAFESITEEWDD